MVNVNEGWNTSTLRKREKECGLDDITLPAPHVGSFLGARYDPTKTLQSSSLEDFVLVSLLLPMFGS